jgi:hypothetical protein
MADPYHPAAISGVAIAGAWRCPGCQRSDGARRCLRETRFDPRPSPLGTDIRRFPMAQSIAAPSRARARAGSAITRRGRRGSRRWPIPEPGPGLAIRTSEGTSDPTLGPRDPGGTRLPERVPPLLPRPLVPVPDGATGHRYPAAEWGQGQFGGVHRRTSVLDARETIGEHHRGRGRRRLHVQLSNGDRTHTSPRTRI